MARSKERSAANNKRDDYDDYDDYDGNDEDEEEDDDEDEDAPHTLIRKIDSRIHL